MITINSLRIDATGENIILDASTETANRFTGLVVWNNESYEDPAQSIDLTALIDGSTADETITINADTYLNTKFLTGAWFFRLTTDEESDNIYTGVAANLYHLYECMLNKVAALHVDKCSPSIEDDCGECEGNVFFMDMLLQNTGKMLQFGLFTEASNAINELEELCDVCPTCNDMDDPIIASGSGYATVENQVIEV